MEKITFNIDVQQAKIKAFVLLSLYLSILTITTFHHHPIDLGNNNHNIENHFNEVEYFKFSADECPIISFAQNGFNCYSIKSISTLYNFYTNANFNRVAQIFYFIPLFNNNSLRGPPF